MSEKDMSQKIKELRTAHHMTLEQVAEQVGVGKSTVRKWEVGQIANMRRDKIAKLAQALHTTPAYLMGWTESQSPWVNLFCNALAKEIANINIEDAHEVGIDIDRIQRIIDGEEPLSFDYACDIVDQLGISFDDLLGFSKEEKTPISGVSGDGCSEIDMEIINLLISLSEDKRKEALNYLRYLASRSENS